MLCPLVDAGPERWQDFPKVVRGVGGGAQSPAVFPELMAGGMAGKEVASSVVGQAWQRVLKERSQVGLGCPAMTGSPGRQPGSALWLLAPSFSLCRKPHLGRGMQFSGRALAW